MTTDFAQCLRLNTRFGVRKASHSWLLTSVSDSVKEDVSA